MGKLKRNSAIELLRIICMMGVIILHFNHNSYGNAFGLSTGINHYVLYYLESLSICAVNVFIIISGYFLCCNNKRSFIKPISLLFQVIVFQVVFYFVNYVIFNSHFSGKSFIVSFFPCNYFVILYLVMYLLSPLFNIVINKLSYKNLKTVLILLIIVFVIGNTLVDVSQNVLKTELKGLSTIGIQGDQAGYTIVNFFILYYVGAYIRKTEHIVKHSRIKCLFAISIFSFIIFIWSTLNNFCIITGSLSAGNYCNPFVVLLAMYIFILFKDMKFNSKIINELSKGAFTVYLTHAFFFKFVPSDIICNMHWPMMVCSIILVCICMYLIGWIIFRIWNLLTSGIFKLLEKNIPVLSKDIYSDFRK